MTASIILMIRIASSTPSAATACLKQAATSSDYMRCNTTSWHLHNAAPT